MFTVPKHHASQSLPATPLVDAVRLSLRLRWSGDTSHDQVVKQFLYECHERNRWVQCDCASDPSTNARPLLAVRRTETTITLARMTGPGRIGHAECCGFNHGSIDIGTEAGGAPTASQLAFGLSATGRAREITQVSLKRPAQAPTFYIDPAELTLAAQAVEAPKEREGDRTTPSEITPENNMIGRRMLYLMHGAQLNMLRRKLDHPAQFRQFLEFCKTVPIPRGGHLIEMIQARPLAFENGYLAQCARQAAHKGLGRTCWWICPITDFNRERGVFLANDEGIDIVAPVPGHIRFFGSKIETVFARFPALMLARCDETGILDAYAHPIASVNRWCLVDSHLEREVLSEIRAELPAVADDFDVDVVIHKPLYQWLDSGERPDIVLTAAVNGVEHHLVIEVMGYQGEKYAARKIQLRQNVLAMPRCSFVEDRRAHDGQQPPTHIRHCIDRWLQSVCVSR